MPETDYAEWVNASAARTGNMLSSGSGQGDTWPVRAGAAPVKWIARPVRYWPPSAMGCFNTERF